MRNELSRIHEYGFMKLKKGDNVLIISGKDRGKTGKILRVFPKERKVLVEGVSLRKKHARPRRANEKGQVLTMPSPIDVSNVKLICSSCGKPTRVGYKIGGDRKFRVCKRCGRET